MFEEKFIGIWNTEGKNYKDMGYWKKIYCDILHKLSSQEFLTF